MAKKEHKHGPGVVTCEKCDREFDEAKAKEYPGKVYVHKGKVMCADCLVEMGVSPDSAEPYSVYLRTHTDQRAGRGF